MMKFNIKNTNEYKNLLNNRAVAGIIRNRASITETRQIIDNYFNWLKEKYPTVTSSLDNLLKQKEQDLNEAINSQQESRIRALIFDILEASAKEIREQSQQRLDKLFTQSTPLDFQKVDKKEIENLRIDSRIHDTSDVIFLVNGLIEEVFFNLIPRELEKELNREPKVELSELPAEWNTKRNELLLSICSKSIGKVRHLSDLEPVEEAINEKCQELIDIIQKLRSGKSNLQHQKLLDKVQELTTQLQDIKKLKKEIHDVAFRVNQRWARARIIDRKEVDNVLGKDWELDLSELTTLEEVKKRQTKLIEAIDQREKTEKKKQVEYEEEIQVEIDKAQGFISNISNSNLTIDEADKLLDKLKVFWDEWGGNDNPVPAKGHAFLNKNKENALGKIIQDLRIKISCEEAISAVTEELEDKENVGKDNYYPLESYNLENKYSEFASILRRMENVKEINLYENGMIKSIAALRRPWSRAEQLIKTVRELLDKDNDSYTVQENRKNLFKFLFKLEEYNSPQADELTRLIYIKRRLDMNSLIAGLLKELRTQAETRLTSLKKGLESQGIVINQNEFASYQQRISRANSQELQAQKYENEFSTKVLQQNQAQIVQPPNK